MDPSEGAAYDPFCGREIRTRNRDYKAAVGVESRRGRLNVRMSGDQGGCAGNMARTVRIDQMRQYTSTWRTEAVAVKWPLKISRFTQVPLPVWALLTVVIAFLTAGLIGGVPQASNPAAEQLGTELSLASAELRGLQSEMELRALEIERMQLIHTYSGEFRIPADRAQMIYDIALAEGINPDLAFNLVRVESAFRRTAVSPVGAVGLTQVRPSTARWLDPTVTMKDLFEPAVNLHLGFRYFRYLLDEYNGDTRLALLAYNRGPGRVGSLLTMGIDPANGYARAVLGE